MRTGGALVALAAVAGVLLAPHGLRAQDAPAPAAQAAEADPAVPPADALSPDALEKLVAPIALYPDSLLAQVLAASTEPLQIVQWIGAAASIGWIDGTRWLTLPMSVLPWRLLGSLSIGKNSRPRDSAFCRKLSASGWLKRMSR